MCKYLTIYFLEVPYKGYIFAPRKYRGVEQLVARWAHNPKVAGSSPAPATKKEGHRKNDDPLCI